MQEFIEDINSELPNLSTYRIYKLLNHIKFRYQYYGTFWLWKREWPKKLWISERQMTYFINLMINYWFLEVKKVIVWNRKFTCRIYKVSSYLKEIITEIKDYVKVSNLSDKIKSWNNSQDTLNYLKGIVTLKTKYNKTSFKLNGIKYTLWKWWILNLDTNKMIWLFDLLMEYYGENKIYNLAYKLKILW